MLTMLTKVVCGCALFLVIGLALASPALASPSPTNPLCYDSQSYRNTHDQECLIDPVPAPGSEGSTGGGTRGPGGLLGVIGGVLHGLTGGLL